MTDLPDYAEQEQEAVGLSHWEWIPGMNTSCGRIVDIDPHDGPVVYTGGEYDCITHRRDLLPDFSDEATRYLLLELVKRAWGVSAAPCAPFNGFWYVFGIEGGRPNIMDCDAPLAGWLARSRNEVDASIAALKAAPKKVGS